jgi:hypothetical protein
VIGASLIVSSPLTLFSDFNDFNGKKLNNNISMFQLKN